MIFTIGRRDTYHEALKASRSRVYKVGKTSDYGGGAVWETFEEAENWKNSSEGRDDLIQAYGSPSEEFEVFGIEANWQTQTTPTDYDWNVLLIDAPIIDLCGEVGNVPDEFLDAYPEVTYRRLRNLPDQPALEITPGT